MSADNIREDEEETLSPRNNPDLFGHEQAEGSLHAAWVSGHLHHAWLLSGPEGIGKATLAYRFARFLLSQGKQNTKRVGTASESDLFTLDGSSGPEGVPSQGLFLDPRSRLFQRVAAGGHADLLTVTRSLDLNTKKLRSKIVVDDVRRISSFLHMTAAEGGARVVIIDPGDEMNRNAANALLKGLEEPPNNTVILIVSHTPWRLLPTIRSRCLGLRLAPLGEADFATVIARLQPSLGTQELAMLFRLSGGSPGKATRLLKEGGLELYHEVLELLSTLPDDTGGRRGTIDTAALHALADRVVGKKGEATYFTVVDILSSWISRLIRLGVGHVGDKAVAWPEESQVMHSFLAAASLDQWLEVWDNLEALFAQTDSLNLDRRQAILNAFFNLEKAVRA